MTWRLPVAAIDYLLYNYLHLRKEVEQLGLRQSGVGKIPPKGGRPSSPVEVMAIERAELTLILDAVKHGWQALSPDLREVATLRYRKNMGRRAIMKRCFLSEATYDRRLRAVRAVVAGYLGLISDAILIGFWGRINPQA
jgi:alkylhydroperoxidase family enzyme